MKIDYEGFSCERRAVYCFLSLKPRVQGVVNLKMTDISSIFRSTGDVCTNVVNSSMVTYMPTASAGYDQQT